MPASFSPIPTDPPPSVHPHGPTDPDWLRSGKAHSPRALTLFGTQHIKTGQWVRLAQPIRGRCRPFSRPILPRQPLASFGKRPLTRNWLRSGKAHSPRASTLFGTQHIKTGQWVRLRNRLAGDVARFLCPSSRDSHWLRLVIRRWLRSGKTPARSIDVFRNSTHQNWYWLRLGKPFHGRSRPFSRPILPRQPLASFGNTALASFGEENLASLGETTRTVRRQASACPDCHRTADAMIHHE